jgi:hypothetical protein
MLNATGFNGVHCHVEFLENTATIHVIIPPEGVIVNLTKVEWGISYIYKTKQKETLDPALT